MTDESGGEHPAGRRLALRFVVLLGVVSLFADVTYEGARSIAGPFLALLGASGTAVGIVSGLGELAGYGLRLVSGWLVDRTGRYWLLTLVGYTVNLLAVPLLALAGRWEIAAGLLVVERIGKAVRTPARDAMLAHATSQLGHGWGFGLHEAMDQVGALTGPLLAAAVLALKGDFRAAFVILLVPALLALGSLFVARFHYPNPRELESVSRPVATSGLTSRYWLYLAATACVAAGYADFPLLAFHFQRTGVVVGAMIPTLYALAMGVDALAALLFGRLFDRLGVGVLAGAVVVASGFAPAIFLGGRAGAIAGMVLWGIGMGAQESVMRAMIATLVPAERRGAAYGTFHAAFGLAWFAGSAAIGVLYDVTLVGLVAFSVVLQLAAVPLLLLLARRRDEERT